MWQRLTLYDVRVIGHYLGVLILFLTIGLLIPFVTALVFQEWEPASHYLLTMGITLIAGSLLRFLRIQPGRLTRQQALVVTGLSWIVLAFFASIPLYLSGHFVKYLDALFDAVSGITTTGVSIIVDLDHLSYADNMWRFVMHAMGGLGLVVVGLSFGLFGKAGGASLFSSEGRSEHVVPNVVQTTQFISRIAASFILLSAAVMTALCVASGMSPTRAVLHSLWVSISAFMTGGFTPMSQSIVYYHSAVIDVALMVVMLLGSINFAVHSEILKGRIAMFFQDMEIRATFIWFTVIIVVFAAALSVSPAFSDLPTMLRRDLFTVVSAFSTTGFLNITPYQLTDTMTSGAFLVVAVLMGVGGGSGSTAGGIKVNRLGLIAKSIVATIKETLSPDSARVVVSYNHLGRKPVTSDLVREAMTVTALYAVTYIIGTLVGIAHGYEAPQAIFDSVAMASNAGLTSGVIVPGMPFSLESFYLFEMWAGRLEFVTLLALLAKIFVSIVPRQLSDLAHRKGEC